MKSLAVIGALALALVLQTKLAPFLVLGTSPLDLVLIVVVYVAITSGPTTGLVGLASTQFIVAGPLPRFLTFLASTVIHAGIFIGLYELLNLRDFGFPWGGVLGQGVANALVGIVVLQAIELLSGGAERQKQRSGGSSVASRRLD